MRTRYWAAIILWGLYLFAGCDNKSSPTDSDNRTTEPVNWVGSAAIYTDVEGKKEYSLLYFYTEWCGFCRKMDTISFADKDVVGIINDSFNAVRINAESDTLVSYFDTMVSGSDMKTIYEISGYPTICVFKGNGTLIARGLGYTAPDDLIFVLNKILSGEYDP